MFANRIRSLFFLLFISVLLTACFVGAFTLIKVLTPTHPLAQNEVAFVHFEFQATNTPDNTSYSDTVVVLQVPDSWLVLDGFIGAASSIRQMPRVTLDWDTVPAADAGMQLVAFRNPFEGSNNRADRGFLAFVADGENFTAGDIKGIYGRIGDSAEFMLIAPDNLNESDYTFSAVANPTEISASDLIFGDSVISSPAASLQVVAYLPTDRLNLQIGPDSGSTSDFNQYGYRIFLTATPNPETIAVSEALPLPLLNAPSVFMTGGPGARSDVTLLIDTAQTDENAVYFYDIPLYKSATATQESVRLSILGELDLDYHVSAVAMVTNETPQTSFDFSSQEFVTSAVRYFEATFSFLSGDTDVTAPGEFIWQSPDGSIFSSYIQNNSGSFSLSARYLKPDTTYVLYNRRDGEEYQLLPSTITTGALGGSANYELTLTDQAHRDPTATAEISGTVMQNGEPVAGIRIFAQSSDLNADGVESGGSDSFTSRGATSYVTDEQGRYKLFVRPGANYRIIIGRYFGNDPGPNKLPFHVFYNGPDTQEGVTTQNLNVDGNYTRQRQQFNVTMTNYADFIQINENQQITLPDINLPPVHQVSGRIVDQNNQPVNGVNISLGRIDGSFYVNTDSDGNFTLHAFENTAYWLEAGGCERDAQQNCLREFPWTYYTGADTGMAVGTYNEGAYQQAQSTAINLSESIGNLNIRLKMPEPVSSVISGVILKNGQPVAGIPVMAESDDLNDDGVSSGGPDRFVSRGVTPDVTDEQGRYALMVRPGANYRVRLGGKYYLNDPVPEQMPITVYYNGPDGVTGVATQNQNTPANYSRNWQQHHESIIDYADLITLGADQEITLPDINLPSIYSISGQVVDANNQPIQRINVNAFNSDGGWGFNTDSEGQYQIYLVAGDAYRVQAGGCERDEQQNCLRDFPRVYFDGSENGTSSYTAATEFDLSANVSNVNFRLVPLAPVSSSISGTVFRQGQPVAGIPVYAESVDLDGDGEQTFSGADYYTSASDGSRALTDENGQYTIAVRPGSNYRVILGGRYFSNDEEPEALPYRVYYNGPDSTTGITTTNGSSTGNFSRYSEQFSQDQTDYADLITVPENTDITVATVDIPFIYQVSGQVADTNGDPVARVSVIVETNTSGDGYQTDNQGRFKAFVTAGQTYHLRAGYCARDEQNNCVREFAPLYYNGAAGGLAEGEFAAGANAKANATAIEPSGDIQHLNMRLTPLAAASATITGLVQKNGAGLVGIPVFAESLDLDNDGEMSFSSTDFYSSRSGGTSHVTDANGRYTISVRPGANYRVILGGNSASGDPVSAALPYTVYYNGPNSITGVTSNNTNTARNYTRNFSAWGDVTDYADLITATDNSTVTLATLSVPDIYSISGRVVDSTGSPINRMNVSVVTGSYGWGSQTDSNGDYRAYVEGGQAINVAAGPCAYDQQYNCARRFGYVYYDGSASGLSENNYTNGVGRQASATSIVPQSNITHINFEMTDPLTLSGRILVDGAVPGSKSYQASVYSETLKQGFGANVDSDTGNFTFNDVLPASDYRLTVYQLDENQGGRFVAYYSASQSAGTRSYNDATLLNIDSNTSGIEMNLAGPASLGTISGTITIPAGVVEGVHVSVYSESKSGQGRYYAVDSNQTTISYTIDGLPPSNDYYLSVYPSGGLQYAYYAGAADGSTSVITRNWQSRTLLSATAGVNLSNIDLTLPQGETLQGTISISGDSSCDTAPGCEVFVSAYSQSLAAGFSQQVRIQTTGGSGSADYRISGMDAAADYRLQAEAWGTRLIRQMYAGSADGATQSQTSDWAKATLLDPSLDGLKTNGADLSLTTGSTLSGTITLAQAAQTDTWVSVQVYSQQSRSSFSGSARVMAGENTATYEFPVEPRSGYRVYVHSDRYSVTSPSPMPESLDLNSDQVLNFSLAQGNTVSGYVRDAEGNPVTGVHVNAAPVNASGMQWRGASTDSNGFYSIGGLSPAHSYTLRADPADYARTDMNDRDNDGAVDGVVNAVIAPADVSANSFGTASFVLSQGEPITGVIRDTNGNLLTNAWVSAFASSQSFGAVSNNNGVYSIYGLSSGTQYDIWVYHPELGSKYVGKYVGGAENVNYQYSTGFRIAGSVSVSGGSNVAEGYISLYRDDGNAVFDELSDEFIGNYFLAGDGSFTVPLVPDGTYFARARIPGYQIDTVNTSNMSNRAKAIVVNGANVSGVAIHVTAIVNNNNSIVGRIVNSNSVDGISSIEIVVLQADEIAGTITTTVDTEFSLGSLLSGQYDVYAYAYNAQGTIIASAEIAGVTATSDSSYTQIADITAGNVGDLILTGLGE